MPTATISDTTWAAASAAPCPARLSVRALRLPRIRGAFLAVELALLAAALVHTIQTGSPAGAFVLLACCEFFFHVHSLDRAIISSPIRSFIVDVIGSVASGSAVAWLLFAIFGYLRPAPVPAIAATLIAILLPLALRPVFCHLVTRQKLVEGVLVAGTGELAAKLYVALTKTFSPETNSGIPQCINDRPIAIDFPDFEKHVNQSRVSRVIVAEQHSGSRAALAEALLAPRLRGLHVTDALDFYEENTGKIWLEAINPEWFVYTNGFDHGEAGDRLDRAFDILLALSLIILTAPIMLLVAIAVRLTSPGPILFRQSRVGLQGKLFTMFKFRSMREDAERVTGPVWSSERDSRVTLIGGLLRKYRLDELPQAFNVLRGDMSFVGPRPERPCFVECLDRQVPFYSLRHYVKPGITGWAQVMYPYGGSVEDAYEKLQYDLYYAKHKSFGCNVWILLMTVRTVLFGRGR